MRVGIRKVGLDVIDRRAVHQICARDDQNVTEAILMLHAFELHAGKADGVRPERRARRKNAHALVAAKARRAHRRRPCIAHGGRELPDKPQVRKTLDAAQRVGIAVLRLEDDLRAKRGDEAALARDAEFFRKVRVDSGNDFHCIVHRMLLSPHRCGGDRGTCAAGKQRRRRCTNATPIFFPWKENGRRPSKRKAFALAVSILKNCTRCAIGCSVHGFAMNPYRLVTTLNRALLS